MLPENYFERFTLAKIEELTREILSQYHPSLQIPIPLEDIVENDLKIRISPELNFHKSTGVVCSIRINFEEIKIDEHYYKYDHPRTRCEVASQIAHKYIHADLFDPSRLKSLGTWRDYESSFTELEHASIKYHIESFAGYLLVPTGPMLEELNKYRQRFADDLIKSDDLRGVVKAAAIGHLAHKFKVTEKIIRNRFENELLHEYF